jgi:hypothetical protein
MHIRKKHSFNNNLDFQKTANYIDYIIEVYSNDGTAKAR